MKMNSGESAPKTGEYKVVEQNGKVMGKIQIKKGQTLPPTQTSTQHFEID